MDSGPCKEFVRSYFHKATSRWRGKESKSNGTKQSF